ncbi:hypothetical protein O1611_g2086 [Lasiodiplodia mahajangana]|uniref:Uncharacterized protein n=1 Tax=Lasiodiplodia mahajangana TaxID=1108764 RepID=A0ACC2JVV9_9PEZI|nr:hypothetical protein O1611_g2086 [Lasiodiplodia mahajangana]
MIIQAHPFGTHLDAVRASCNQIINSPAELDIVDDGVLRDLALSLIPLLLGHPVSRLLPSRTGRVSLGADLRWLDSSLESGDLSLNRIRPLLTAVLTNASDTDVWKQVYHTVAESATWQYTASSVMNSSEERDRINEELTDELGVMYVDVPNFQEAFFGGIPDLKTASEDIFQKCTQGTQPLFQQQGWAGWPEDARLDSVLTWFANLVERLLQLAQHCKSTAQRLLAQPNTPPNGSVAGCGLYVGFVDDRKVVDKALKYHWSRILIPGVLKSNPDDDVASEAHLDIAKYVKKNLYYPTNAPDGQRFVLTILGFLWMGDVALGFDPTIIKSGHQQYIEIERNMKTERLVIGSLIRPVYSMVGRATTCWKAYLEDNSAPFVIKDSWQVLEHDEGELLQEATAQSVTNVVRHYYHETVRVHGKDDDIQSNVRKGLDITRASNYQTRRNSQTLDVELTSRDNSIGSKRPSSQTGALLPPNKRSRLGSASLTNRIHRRIVLRDYGKPIYKASSRVALLNALEGCITGHESLYKAGFLHRDISINNLIINEDDKSLSSFLIDLDLAAKVNRIEAPGSKGIPGTRAFMAIGVLMGEVHSFMDDLESFFWVLFWICIHYNRYGQAQVVPEFNKWNTAGTVKLVRQKKGVIDEEADFLDIAKRNFTSYYQALIPCINKLRRVVFPDGRRWKQVDDTLYLRMRDILRTGQNDPRVIADNTSPTLSSV